MDARRHSARRRRGRVAGCARAIVGDLRAVAQCRQGAAQLPDLRRRLRQHALQHADADHAGERQGPEPRVGVSGGGHRKLAADTHRGRRHHVPDAAAERRRRAGCHDRPRVLDLSLHERGRHCLLRLEQPRRRRTRGDGLHGHARRPPRGNRREKRPAGVEDPRRREQGRIFDYRFAARLEGSHCRRRGRRRIWHPRIHLRIPRADRQGVVEVLHGSGPGRTGTRDVGSVPAEFKNATATRKRGSTAERRCGSPDRSIPSSI